jgi:hypothetical protein
MGQFRPSSALCSPGPAPCQSQCSTSPVGRLPQLSCMPLTVLGHLYVPPHIIHFNSRQLSPDDLGVISPAGTFEQSPQPRERILESCCRQPRGISIPLPVRK